MTGRSPSARGTAFHLLWSACGYVCCAQASHYARRCEHSWTNLWGGVLPHTPRGGTAGSDSSSAFSWFKKPPDCCPQRLRHLTLHLPCRRLPFFHVPPALAVGGLCANSHRSGGTWHLVRVLIHVRLLTNGARHRRCSRTVCTSALVKRPTPFAHFLIGLSPYRVTRVIHSRSKSFIRNMICKSFPQSVAYLFIALMVSSPSGGF